VIVAGWGQGAYANPNFKNPAAVQAVLSGGLRTANASWWGFDPLDATASVQGAINSGAPRVVIPYTGEDWIVGPIVLASDQEIFFEPGVIVTAKEGLFKGEHESLFTAHAIRNVTLTGYGAILRMRKADYAPPGYASSTGRHVLAILGAEDFRVRGFTLQSAGGDGVHIGPARGSSRLPSEDVAIEDCVCNDNLRYGISIVSGTQVVVDNCTVRNTGGAAPESGIGLKPEDKRDFIADVEVRNCLAINNDGAGYVIDVSALDASSPAVDLRVVNSRVRNSGGHGFVATHGAGAGPGGLIEVVNSASEGTNSAGALLSWGLGMTPTLRFRDSKWRDASKRSSQSSIEIDLLPTSGPIETDGIDFANCYVHDKRERSTVRFREVQPENDQIVAGIYRIKDPSDFLGGPPAMPNSDEILRCIVNLNGHAIDYDPERWATVPLITDFTVHLDTTIDEREVFAEVSRIAEETNPDLLLGRYISGSRVESGGEVDRYPPAAVNAEDIPADWIRAGTNRVDISIPDAADRFAELIIAQFRAAPKPVLFLDNIVHPTSLRGWFPWADTCRLIQKVREGVNAAGGRVIANIAMVASALPDADVALIADAADGLALEMPLHPNARISLEKLKRHIKVYRQWLDAGKTIVFIPRAETEEIEDESRFLASFAMAIREPGDRLFVAWSFWKPAPDWQHWPETFGPPSGSLIIHEDTFVLKRRFARGTLEVNVAASTVGRTP
jgi:hypothetical protein